jgi:endogenous inhibitor of DNA gyrase (YacG/DUF329 family)
MKRKQPTKKRQIFLLQNQENRCYWCGNLFGSEFINKKYKAIILVPVWDHYVPFSFTLKSNDEQFVASCQLCNQFKGSFVVSNKNEDNVRSIIRNAWDKHDLRFSGNINKIPQMRNIIFCAICNKRTIKKTYNQRFCSDRCRDGHHNEIKAKAMVFYREAQSNDKSA